MTQLISTLKRTAFLAISIAVAAAVADAQPVKAKVRTVTVPISIFTKQEMRTGRVAELVEAATLLVKEDKDQQEILSIRSVSNAPLSIAILIQDEISSSINLQLKPIANFIRSLPTGSRVMVGYLRGPTIQTKQKFTTDLEKAARSLSAVAGSAIPSGNGPYAALSEALKRFEGVPAGRRSVLLISDGYEVSSGDGQFGITQSLELESAVTRAQRASVAIYSIFFPSNLTANTSNALSGQSGLQKLADETGGRSYFSGTIAPISFDNYFTDVNMALGRQFALTYLSTHMKKGYHRLEIASTNPEIKIEHPKGYYYR